MKILIIALFVFSPIVKAQVPGGNIERLINAANLAADQSAEDGANIQGSYIARFGTLNSHVVGSLPGSAHIRREDKKISAFVRLFAGTAATPHFQNVHMGNRCPTIADDTNFDGYLDYEEVIRVVGPAVIPLDENINTQSDGNRIWPKSLANGSYSYLKEGKFKNFWKDLKSKDKDLNDNIMKLSPWQGLAITGKVIIILGVSEDKIFPATVKPRSRYKVWATFPIACGVFMPVFNTPGVLYEDKIPGPIAPVEAGQDRPAAIGPNDI